MDTRPLVPEDIRPAALSLPRAAYAACWATANRVNAADTCRRIYPHDRAALGFLERSATTGATTSGVGWASDLMSTSVAAWLGSLAPASAAAELISRGTVLPIPPGGSISVPGRLAPPTAAPWAGEGLPIPARAYTLVAALLKPKKIGVIAVMSRELILTSAAESVIAALLAEDAAAGLDAAYFSNDAGTAPGHHKGLLAGLVAGTGSAVMADDLAKLASAVMTGGSGGDVVFIASPGRAAAAQTRIAITSSATLPILPSLAVPADRVIAVDAASLVHGTSGDADVTGAADMTTIDMRDDPGDIGVPGSPPVVGAPAQSLFQTGQVGTRVLVEIAFGARRPGAVAFADNCTW
jgi:Phage capsid family